MPYETKIVFEKHFINNQVNGNEVSGINVSENIIKCFFSGVFLADGVISIDVRYRSLF